MPSKLEHELIKLRGEVTETGKVYTSSIASLQDAITALELEVKALESNKTDTSTKIRSALSKASNALSIANSCLKKSGDKLDNNCWIDNFQASNVIAFKAQCAIGINIHDSTGAIIARIGSTTSGLKSDIIEEYTGGAGVTVDGRDVGADGTKLDAHHTKLLSIDSGADVTGSNSPQAHKASHNRAGSDVPHASKINTTSQAGAAVDDDMYFNLTDKKFYIYYSGSWYRSAAFTIVE